MATVERNIPSVELSVDSSSEGMHVLIPQLGSDEHHMDVLERLLKLSGEHSSRVWTIDLSRHPDISIGLASVLAAFGEHARHAGCEVRFTGIGRASSTWADAKGPRTTSYCDMVSA